ncbi:hypothetical protein HIM_08124 [Hirsutella minnesotensis 3608]|uniref:Uncharacterized protein n=1 Tax=Hirsutella minnesotensis 3608 TaxID=1043627 RepID=A0A0F7ZMR4_9HYPO|nr:hypothetical protein HIM_08124 [Hirsutella minnesotensis 3608]
MAAVQELLTTSSPVPLARSDADADANDVDGDGRPCQSPVMLHGRSLRGAPEVGDTRTVVIIYGNGQDKLVSLVANILGKPLRMKDGFQSISRDERGAVVGISVGSAKEGVETRDRELSVAINAHCVDLGMPPDSTLSAHCDYEFLYSDSPFLRRYLTRFIAHVLSQISHHEELMAKPRTYFISTTFPDVRAALPNLDILTVGSDAVELRVDLLQEPIGNGAFASVPSLNYVGEQVMLLRQRTELPIIFTTRCTNENGRFPMDDPDLYHRYLYKAIQWGVEYIDVELWLPEAVRRDLFQRRGNSRIMSAFHDFSGTFRWPSPYARDVFRRSCPLADLVKMIAIINEPSENLELEHFRSLLRTEFPNAPPFSGVNMKEVGQISRTLNKVFTPITHPLLPLIAAPGQMSIAQIHSAQVMLGQLPRKRIYGVSSAACRSAVPPAPFYEKCFNELGLPHQFTVVERQPDYFAGLEALCNQKDFGGACLDPGVAHQTLAKHSSFFATLNVGRGPILTEAARAIGIVDTIVVDQGHVPTAPLSMIPSAACRNVDSSMPSSQTGLDSNASLIFDNAGWRGIMHTLIRDLAPSAYFGRSAVVVASASDDAAPTFYALKALKIAKIYTVGFRTPPALARHAPPIEQFVSMESLQRARSVADDSAPFVIVSALGPEKCNLVSMLVRVFGSTGPRNGSSVNKVFLNLADVAGRIKSDPSETAEKNGFAAYGAADVAAFSTVESLRLLVGQNVPYSFVRLASGRNLF